MPDKLIRTLGASVILIALAVMAAIQIGFGEPSPPVEIVDAAPGTSSTVGPTLESASESAPSSAPASFTYRIGLQGAPSTYNFWEYFGSPQTVWDAYVLGPTKGSLYRLESSTQSLVPELASEQVSPTWGDAGWHVVVPIGDDHSWSDGVPVTAYDFEFTFDTVRRLDLGGQWLAVFPDVVDDVSAIDEKTLDVSFSERPSLEVWPYGVGTAPVLAAHFWEQSVGTASDSTDLYELDPDGDPASGPLELVDTSSEVLASRANPGYGGDLPDTVEYKIFPSEGELVEALESGAIDTLISPKGLTPSQSASLSARPEVATVASPGFGIRYLSFNLERAPMDDLEFRRAVALLLDRDALGNEVDAEPASTLLPKDLAAWFDEGIATEIEDLHEKEPAEALEEALTGLRSAGYSWDVEPEMTEDGLRAGSGLEIDGRGPATLTVLTAGDSYEPSRNAYAQRVAETIALLGFEVIPVVTDFDTVVDLTFTPNDEGDLQYDMALLGWSLGNPGLPSFYADLFRSGSANNNTGYASDEFDALLDLYEAANDVETAQIVLWEMERMLADDLPILPLYSSRVIEAYRSDSIVFETELGLGGIQGTSGGIQIVSKVTDG